MPREISVWRKNLCEALDALADEAFQRANWFGKGQYISSPEEMYNELFSDFSVEDFVCSAEVGLTDLQKSLGQDLIAKLEAFDREMGPDLSADVVVGHIRR